MINPKCDINSCGKELNEFGAIVIGPPDEDRLALKLHVCIDCYKKYFLKLFIK